VNIWKTGTYVTSFKSWTLWKYLPPVTIQRKQFDLNTLFIHLTEVDGEVYERIEKAINHIHNSLASDLWEDGYHLTKKGKRVFDEEKKAVKELMKIIEDGTAFETIFNLVFIDKDLALTAIQDAIDSGGDQKELEKANKEIAKGEAEEVAGGYDKAIEHYKKAWEHAQKALK